jgi:arylesterase/paraoxonase
MKRRWWFAIAALFVLALLWLRILFTAGELATLAPHFAGTCSAVHGMPGAEDISFHPTLGYAYVSSDDRRAGMAGQPVQGGIYRYDPSGEQAPVLLTPALPAPFHPHGISLYVDAQGKQTLYVINHPRMGEGQIERFTLAESGLLVRDKTLRDPLLVSPNDLVAIDEERFYVTNDHSRPFGVGQFFEDLAQLIFGPAVARGSVLYFDGKRFHEAVAHTAYANGINRSEDNKTIYLAQALAKTISVYAREPRTGKLALRKVVSLDTAPDNLELDGKGYLYVGAHPKSLAFLAHAVDGSGAKRAPAQVLRMRVDDGSYATEEVYLSEGSPLSAVATAAVHEGRMLLGPVFDREFLSCRIP